VRAWADLSPWAGQAVTVTFLCTVDLVKSVPSIGLDDVALGSWLTPAISGVTPGHLPTQLTDPTAVTITGENFIPPISASIGAIGLQDVTWINENTLQATLPPGLGLGRHPVRVVNSGGQRGGLPGGLSIGRGLFLPMVLN
jgi:hypothetical protein